MHTPFGPELTNLIWLHNRVATSSNEKKRDAGCLGAKPPAGSGEGAVPLPRKIYDFVSKNGDF